jgi:hypothetical protein
VAGCTDAAVRFAEESTVADLQVVARAEPALPAGANCGQRSVTSYGPDIYTEPDSDPDTLANLGPLRPMAGVWEGVKGSDRHPVVDGVEDNTFVEHYEAHPIDAQTNGPQLFYGLRYHTHITKPAETETFHDQVGYWLWEPAADTVTLTLGIPRAQVLLASGPAQADATDFELTATEGSEVQGIVTNPFLHQAFRTLSYRIHITIGEGTWSYEEEGVLQIPGREQPFSHIDRNTLTKIGSPQLNPRARQARRTANGDGDGSLGIGSLRAAPQTR